jgi:hypothetical protein
MKVLDFKHNDSTSGTSLQGYVNTTYDTLVAKFGEPTLIDGDKITVEWVLTFKVVKDIDEDFEYVTATIYDWKEERTPMGQYRWHIGGNSHDAVEAVETSR